MRKNCPEVPCIVIANKSGDSNARSQKTDFHAPLFFTDAVEGSNVEEVFNNIVDQALEFKSNEKSEQVEKADMEEVFCTVVERAGGYIFDMDKLAMRLTG